MAQTNGTKPADWKANLKADFARNGYAIIKSAISPERAQYYRDQQLSWLEGFKLGFDRNDKSTWNNERVPVNMKHGMYGCHSIAHEKFMWKARLEPGVIAPFAELWGTDELLVSFDGMNVTPPSTVNPDVQIAPWPHTDQRGVDREFLCAQGILNTGPGGPNDGGLIVVAGSSALWDEFWDSERGKAKLAAKRPPNVRLPTHVAIFAPDDVAWFAERGCKPMKLELKPGDLVLWDSRTIHYNCAPAGEDLRSAMYICYGPAAKSSAEDLEIKKTCFETHQGTTHWPHMHIEAGRGDPSHRQEPVEQHEQSERLLQLAGVKPYVSAAP